MTHSQSIGDELRLHLAAIVESAHDAIVSKTLDGRITSWNSAAEHLFGYTHAEAVGQLITLIIPPELQHEEQDILAQLRQGKRVEHYETTRVAKNGRRIQVSLSISPVRDASGSVVGAAKIARDITEAKRVEAALRDQAHALATLNRVARTVAGELDLQRLVQVITDAATEVSGAAFGAFVYGANQAPSNGHNPYTLSGTPREAFAAFLRSHSAPLFSPTFRGEGVVRCADVTLDARYHASARDLGEHLTVRSYLAVPVVSRTGEVIGGLFFGHPEAGVLTERAEHLAVSIAAQAAIGIDNARLLQSARLELQERTRVEESLRRSEQLYRAIGESIEYGIWVCDKDGRNVYASESFLRLVGMTQEECATFGWAVALHPDDVDRTVAAWRECVRTGAKWDFEHRYRGVDGKYHPILARGLAVRDEQGEILCWAGINLDVERLKRAEETLREADRRKDELIAILAHELRNPLAPIRYALSLVRQPGVTDDQRRHAEAVMERQIDHMSRLLEDLLDVARIGRGTLELRKAPMSLVQAVSTAIEAARPFLESKHHTLQQELTGEDTILDADPVRVAQIFTNILINAAKYTDPGGHISLRAWREHGEVVFAVRDNGMGIAPDMQARLFTLFSQDASALERSQGGLGIGLALAKGLVDLHGGSIIAQSAGPEQGSEFTVRLPIGHVVAAPAGVAAREPRPSSLDPLDILVADDNLDSVQLSSELLELWGHRVYRATTGKQALSLAERERPRLLLLDVGMPDLNGYEVAEAVRQQPWGKDMVLIAITGWGRAEDKEQAHAAGFDHHLTKPIDPDKLGALLENVRRPTQ